MNHFVFVVCGSKEHIDKLNFSLKYLTHFSKANILVVTDTSRNESKIEHDDIIDIKTPGTFTHHEASIYLKTGLINFLPDMKGHTFCYLDSDVIAVSSKVDEIFHFEPSPVLFARDHCSFREFSPHAMTCSCLDETIERNKHFYDAVNACFPQDVFSGSRNKRIEKSKLDAAFNDMKKWHPASIAKAITYLTHRYILPKKKIHLGNHTFNKNNWCWYDQDGEIIHFDYSYYAKELEKHTGIRFNKKLLIWEDEKGKDITPRTPQCHHLSEYISKHYKISIPDTWRHWNGGVFLFDKQAKSFMEYWHKITIEAFKSTDTKTRDQATLAVSAWKSGLQHQETLPQHFNFIAEYANPDIRWNPEKGYTYDNYQSSFQPVFLHIYHHWGDSSWSIWQSVLNIGKSQGVL